MAWGGGPRPVGERGERDITPVLGRPPPREPGAQRDEDYVYRVSWRNIRDWALAQLALYETQIVELPQVFLPFATSKSGKTLYEEIQGNRFLLGDGNSNGKRD